MIKQLNEVKNQNGEKNNMGKANYLKSDFYCIQCGNKSLPLARKKSLQKEKFHRKKLYCYHCKEECNHIECKTDDEVVEFLENFNNGLYQEEAEESVSYVKKSPNNKINTFKKYSKDPR